MPHAYDLDTVEDNAFVLSQLQAASYDFCKSHRICRKSDDHQIAFDSEMYAARLKGKVSTLAAHCSISIRMLMDFMGTLEQDNYWDDYWDSWEPWNKMPKTVDGFDELACQGMNIMKFGVGAGPISLRESCNKIIHAEEARLLWTEEESGTFEYWSGIFRLSGKYGAAIWQIEIEIGQWSAAIMKFAELAQESVDWHHVYKHDD